VRRAREKPAPAVLAAAARLAGALFVAGPGCVAQTKVVPEPGVEPTFLQRTQEADGHWSAPRFGGKAEADLRVNALVMLALLADGSTSRNGPSRQQVRDCRSWLMKQQDSNGNLLLRADPDWLLDHAIACYALAEDLRLAKRAKAAGVEAVVKALGVLRTRLEIARPSPSAELRLWTTMCMQSLRASAKDRTDEEAAAAAVTALRGAAAELETTLSKLPAAEAVSPRDRAAALLQAELLRPVDEAAKTTDRASEAAVEPVWPERPLDDPLLTFYVSLTRWLRSGADWKAVAPRLEREVVKVQRARGPEVEGEQLGQTWDPQGEFGARNGRFGTHAGGLLLCTVYYRYCRLQVAAGGD
jgi:hypothetical protein